MPNEPISAPAVLPKPAQRLWTKAYNLAYKKPDASLGENDRQAFAAKQAWIAVKDRFVKTAEGWEPKSIARKPTGFTARTKARAEQGIIRAVKSKSRMVDERMAKEIAAREVRQAMAPAGTSRRAGFSAMETLVVKFEGLEGLYKYRRAIIQKRWQPRDKRSNLAISLEERAHLAPANDSSSPPAAEPNVNPQSLLIENEDYRQVLTMLEPLFEIAIGNIIDERFDPDSVIRESGGIAAAASGLKGQGTAYQGLFEAADVAKARLKNLSVAVDAGQVDRAASLILEYLRLTHFPKPGPREDVAAVARAILGLPEPRIKLAPVVKNPRSLQPAPVVARSVEVNYAGYLPWTKQTRREKSSIRKAVRSGMGLRSVDPSLTTVPGTGPSLVERAAPTLPGGQAYSPSQLTPAVEAGNQLLTRLPAMRHGQPVRHTIEDVKISRPISDRPDGLSFRTKADEKSYDESLEQPEGVPFQRPADSATAARWNAQLFSKGK